jgi:hypothetical protein
MGWCAPITPTTWKAEMKEERFEASPEKKHEIISKK